MWTSGAASDCRTDQADQGVHEDPNRTAAKPFGCKALARVRRSLSSLGFEEVKSARVGKFIELELAGNDRASAQVHIQSMCEKLLANPVIEDFHYEIED